MTLGIPLSEEVLRLFLALLLGTVVGIEREYVQQSAGLRTHILVCLGSAIFTLISISDITAGMEAANQVATANVDPYLTYRLVRDPGRIAAQIVVGIGFIGGGAVLRHGANVRGLTTAASLWVMASIGMLVGVGSYQLAIVATLFSFLVLFIIGGLERTMFKKYLKKFTLLRIQVTAREKSFHDIEQWLEKHFPSKTVEVKTQRNEEQHTATMTYTIDLRGLYADVNQLSRKLNALEGVLSASLKVFHEEKED
jgi:putative Mg2+ transporter-C (MgtC) family protein